MALKWRPMTSLPSSVLLLGYVVIAILLFVAVGGWMVLRMDEVKRLALESSRDAAKSEMLAASDMVMQEAQRQLVRLASWDESYQQLTDDAYYDYWYSNRAMKAGYFPDYVTSVTLYDHNRADLGNGLLETGMPVHLPQQEYYIEEGAGRAFLYLFAPVRAEFGGRLWGYAGIKVDLLQALVELNKFSHIDISTIDITLETGEQIPIGELVGRLEFAPFAMPETEALEGVMHDTMARFLVMAIVLGLIYYLLVSRLLQIPLNRLANYIDALRRGEGEELEGEGQALCVRELEVLRQSLHDYQHNLREMHARLDQKNKELWHLAHQDPLTGIYNRRAYDEDWGQLQLLVRGQRIGISVLLFDCDHFKAINDSYGHAVGDEVIRAVGGCLHKSLREGDRLYRLGGDEFAIHLINTRPADAEQLAIRCQNEVNNYPFKEQLGIKEPVRFSIGIAYAEGTEPAELANLHKYADIAMYRAKGPGLGKIVLYEPEMGGGTEALVSSRYLHAVYRTIEEGAGIVLHYQPVVALGDDRSYYEILVRLEDEEGLIMPLHIFPVVNAEGLQAEFDWAVIRRVAEALATGEIPAGVSFSLNIDGPSLNRRETVSELRALLPYVAGRKIVIEVTETALITNMREASSTLDQLRELGFKIALDDFGSGYSSLRYLSSMPVDIIKFDITMVQDLERNRGQRLIAENVARMILASGYQLVAEGVEGESLFERVRELGFTHAQGFLIGRPAAEIKRGALRLVGGRERA